MLRRCPLPCPAAWRRAPGPGDQRRREDCGAVRGAPRLCVRVPTSRPPRGDLWPQVAPRMPQALDPHAKTSVSCEYSSPTPNPGASWRGDGDHKRSCTSPVLPDWACKELKETQTNLNHNIYMCGFFSRGSDSLLDFHPLRSLGITPTSTGREHPCRPVCVCLVQVESCPYKLCSVDFRSRCVPWGFLSQ